MRHDLALLRNAFTAAHSRRAGRPLEAPGCVTWDRMEYRYFVITRGSTPGPGPRGRIFSRSISQPWASSASSALCLSHTHDRHRTPPTVFVSRDDELAGLEHLFRLTEVHHLEASLPQLCVEIPPEPILRVVALSVELGRVQEGYS